VRGRVSQEPEPLHALSLLQLLHGDSVSSSGQCNLVGCTLNIYINLARAEL
jgi:hypothetical protein